MFGDWPGLPRLLAESDGNVQQRPLIAEIFRSEAAVAAADTPAGPRLLLKLLRPIGLRFLAAAAPLHLRCL